MKFYCHRCNKPYLIADERVRGKILKIRCKNCSAVITVREGMDPGGQRPSGRRSTVITPDPAALAGPGRQASTPSPDHLRESRDLAAGGGDPMSALEEWYLSVDGEQQGPFPLDRAREWLAAQGPDTEVHCWRDGFDDWCLVEEVEAFEGVRRHSRLALLPPPPQTQTPVPPDRIPGLARPTSAPDVDLFDSSDEALTRVDPGPFAHSMQELLAETSRQPRGGAEFGPAQPPQPQRPAPSAAGAGGMGTAAAPPASPTAGPPPSPAFAGRPESPAPSSVPPSYPSLADVAPGAMAPEVMSWPEPPRRGGRARAIVVAVALLLVVAGVLVGAVIWQGRRGAPAQDGDGAGGGGLAVEVAADTPPPLTVQEVLEQLTQADNQASIKTCYEGARARHPELVVERIDVELAVDADGQVTRVSLDSQADTEFGRCLTGLIQGWQFRASATGLTARIPLVFASQP
ncbi:GYF domain-containing protein [Haliangium sp.]|uniref:GYF domain-containing protein n=1 Tax=Haliangium sp. TaxID=2663208 RepID=UPI003D0A9907